MLAIPTFHPSFLIRSADGAQGTAKFADTVIKDLRRALELRGRLPNWDEQIIWKRDETGRLVNLFPTLSECIEFFKRNFKKLTAVDIETTGEEPLDCQILCVGLATCDDAICIPILVPGGADYWTLDEKEVLWRMLGYYLANKQTPKVFQNGSFDTIVLGDHGLPVDGWDHDTMAAHRVVDGELPHSLAFIGSVFTEVPYYKDEVKGDERWIDKDAETLRSYNIRDCLTTLRALPPLLAEIKRWQLEQLYADDLALTKVMVKATLRGVTVDVESRDSEALACPVDWKKLKKAKKNGESYATEPVIFGLGSQLIAEREQALDVLKAIAGHPEFKPSGRALQWFLFTHLQFPVVKLTKKKTPCTDKEAMILLALHAKTKEQEAALKNLAKWKKCSKMIETWIQGKGFQVNRKTGRVHPMWKQLPVSGRMSSSPNCQNLNAKVKRLFRAARGCKLVSIDLSQAELRGMSYFAFDADVLRMYEQNMNIHTINATLLFGVKNPWCNENPIPKGVDTNAATEAFLEEAVPKYLKDTKTGFPLAYADLPVAPEKKWKRIRRLAKNFRFGWQYGAIADTVYKVLRSERDPDTDEPIFPDLELGTVEALKIKTEKMSPCVPRYWQRMAEQVNKQGYFRTPLSGRIRWFRAGPKQNEVVNFPIQSLVADHMNAATLRIARRLEIETNDEAVIVLQVHDSLVIEAPDEWVETVKEILVSELSISFPLLSYPNAVLPPDDPTVGTWLDEV